MKAKSKKTLTALVFVAVAAATAVFSGVNNEDEEQRKKRELTNSETTIEYLTDLPPLPEEIVLQEAPAPEVVQEAPRKSLFRSLISVPLWILGHAAKLLLAPILGKLFSWVLTAAVFFGILCLCLKAIFPDKSLKELLNPKTLLTFACCTGVFIAVFNLPDFIRPDGGKFGWMQLGAGALALLTMILLSSYFIDKKKQPEAAV